jgi:hypothetical protein
MLTPAQKNRLIGFAASLKARGVILIHQLTGAPVNCLIEPSASLRLRKGETVTNQLVTDIIHAKRDDIEMLEAAKGIMEAGTVFTRQDEGTEYRVHERHDDSANVASIMFHCQACVPQEAG